jgi:hypothetical protein
MAQDVKIVKHFNTLDSGNASFAMSHICGEQTYLFGTNEQMQIQSNQI